MSVALEYQTLSENWLNDFSFYHCLFFQDNLINVFRRKTCLFLSLKLVTNVIKLLWSCQTYGCVFSPYPFLCTCTSSFSWAESNEETCEMWAYFLMRICTCSDFLDLEIEKYTQLSSRQIAGFRVEWAQSKALSSVNALRVSSHVIPLCVIWTKACVFVHCYLNNSWNRTQL